MAITLISGNLNTFGDAGTFEADKSTWGFDLTAPLILSRQYFISEWIHSGLSSCMITIASGQQIYFPFAVSKGRASLQGGKKYVAYAWVYCPNSSSAIGGLYDRYHIKPAAGTPNISGLTKISEAVATDVRGVWTLLETRFNTDVFSGSQTVDLELEVRREHPTPELDSTPWQPGYAYAFVDDFSIYEYADVVPPACTLAIDTVNSVVTESTGADGSITVAITGGTAPFEYSKDDGATWQSSNVFTGLAVGVYPVKVREVTTPTCVSSYPFTVNAFTYSFSFTAVGTAETVAGANNGSITVTVTGTVAPFTFSKDGGATYQGGNLFTGLVPGTYTVVVKDAGGITRATNVIIGSGAVLFVKPFLSKNPIGISMNAPPGWDGMTNYRMYCDVQVEEVAGSSVFVSKLKQELYPDSGGVCLFNIRPALRNVFELKPPAYQDAVIARFTDRVKLFKLVTGNMTNYELVPASTVDSLPYLSLYGGLSAFEHASTDFFSWLATNKKFLSMAPVVKWVDKWQEDYLNYYVFGLTTTQLKVSIKAYYDDNTTQTAIVRTISGVVYGYVYRIPAGSTNSGAEGINPAKNLVKYELTLLDQGDGVVSEVRTFMVNRVLSPSRRYIMIVNSLGAHEVHRFTGQTQTKHSVKKEVIQKYLPVDYKAEDGEFMSGENSFSKVVSYSSGFLPNREWRAYMTDVLLTRFFYDVTDGKRYPLVVTTPDYLADEAKSYEHFIRFEAMDAYQNPGFAPAL